MGVVTLGVDVGQRVDPTAICVSEAEWRGDDDHYVVRFLQRLPLGTKYPAVADRLVEIIVGIEEKSGELPERLFVDATGVGVPVCDILREKLDRAIPAGVPLTPVFFTYGDRRTRENGEIKLGKAYLVSRLQSLLQTERLHLPQTAEAEALADELLSYEIKIDQDGHDRYGAFSTGSHDDLVTALGLATQESPGGNWDAAYGLTTCDCGHKYVNPEGERSCPYCGKTPAQMLKLDHREGASSPQP